MSYLFIPRPEFAVERPDLATRGYAEYVVTHKPTGTVIGRVMGINPRGRGPSHRWWSPMTLDGQWVQRVTNGVTYDGATFSRNAAADTLARHAGLLPPDDPEPIPLPDFMVRAIASRTTREQVSA